MDFKKRNRDGSQTHTYFCANQLHHTDFFVVLNYRVTFSLLLLRPCIRQKGKNNKIPERLSINILFLYLYDIYIIMKRIIKLKESDLTKLIKRIVSEMEMSGEDMSPMSDSEDVEKHLAIDFITADNSREKERIMKQAKDLDFDLFRKYVKQYNF